MTATRMEQTISLILLAGTALSAIFVLIGGGLLLLHHGNMPFTTILHHHYTVRLIDLGLICLVLTQVVRVALLVWFYAVTRDLAYTLISLFILSVLIYSML